VGVAIIYRDERADGKVLFEHSLEFSFGFVTVRQLIEARVESEMDVRTNIKPANYLVTPVQAEIILNGDRKESAKRVDVNEQKRIALASFQANGFFMFINSRQLTDLDEVVGLEPDARVSFVKLVPLVGG